MWLEERGLGDRVFFFFNLYALYCSNFYKLLFRNYFLQWKNKPNKFLFLFLSIKKEKK